MRLGERTSSQYPLSTGDRSAVRFSSGAFSPSGNGPSFPLPINHGSFYRTSYKIADCSRRRLLARISPGSMGFEHRRFECPKCDSVQNEVVASDPMKSVYIGWLAGELRAPN